MNDEYLQKKVPEINQDNGFFVYTDLAKLGLRPIEFLLLNKILNNYSKNIATCQTDAELAQMFGCSIATISTTIKNLAKRKLIFKATHRNRGGQYRNIFPEFETINKLLEEQKPPTLEEQYPELCASVKAYLEKKYPIYHF